MVAPESFIGSIGIFWSDSGIIGIVSAVSVCICSSSGCALDSPLSLSSEGSAVCFGFGFLLGLEDVAVFAGVDMCNCGAFRERQAHNL